MSTPLHQLRADCSKTLGNPVRIRALELLSRREHAVAELLPGMGTEVAHLSQRPAVMRRANPVATRKEGSTVLFRLATSEVADPLTLARGILGGVLAEPLEEHRAAAPSAGPPSRARRA